MDESLFVFSQQLSFNYIQFLENNRFNDMSQLYVDDVLANQWLK